MPFLLLFSKSGLLERQVLEFFLFLLLKHFEFSEFLLSQRMIVV